MTRPVLIATPGIVTIWLLACGGGGSPQIPKVAPGTANPGSPGSVPEADDAAPVAPTPPPVTQGPCADDCLLLMEHDFAYLSDAGFCEVCGDVFSDACDLPWPSDDTLPCDRYDWLRNCIYARLGYDFAQAPEWREVFDQESWYEADPDFTWNRVTPVQSENAHTLRRIVNKRRCSR